MLLTTGQWKASMPMSDPITQNSDQQHDERSAEERRARRQEQIRRNHALLKLLDQWDQEDKQEQRETWEIIERMLKEDPFRLREWKP
jgi:hypothetical protein